MRQEILRRLKNIGTAWSQVLHVHVTLGSGDPKVTTSARMGQEIIAGRTWARRVCRPLSRLLKDPDHCVKAYHADQDRAKCAHVSAAVEENL